MSEKFPAFSSESRQERSALKQEIEAIESDLEKRHAGLFEAQRKVEDTRMALIDLLNTVENKGARTKQGVKALGKESASWAADTALLKIPSTLRRLGVLFGGSFGYSQLSYEPPSVGSVVDAAKDLYELATLETGDRTVMDAQANVAEAEFHQQMLFIKGDPEEILEYNKKFAELMEKRNAFEESYKK